MGICEKSTKCKTKQDLKWMNNPSFVLLMDFPEGSNAVNKY